MKKKNVAKCPGSSQGARIRCLVSLFEPGRGLSTLLTTPPNQVSFIGSKIYINHNLSIPSRNLYQVMEYDVLSRDLGW